MSYMMPDSISKLLYNLNLPNFINSNIFPSLGYQLGELRDFLNTSIK